MITTLLTGAALFYCGVCFQIKKKRAEEKQRSLFSVWPIEKISLAQLDPLFKPTHFGPRRDLEINFLPNIKVKGGISDLETWILCAFAKKSKNIFEFGTCSGKTTYLMARNSSSDTRVVTLTLPPEKLHIYQEAKNDSLEAKHIALSESCFYNFYYNETPEQSKITQLFNDSKAFDETLFKEAFDLIFIDGSHTYSYVKNDTEKALKMVRKGGWIFWHDYCGPSQNKDVFKALNEFSQFYPLKHIEKTSLVVLKSN